jgi:hypothetical protein
VISRAIVRVAKDFVADLAIALQSTALILGDGFAARFALLPQLLSVLRNLTECE